VKSCHRHYRRKKFLHVISRTWADPSNRASVAQVGNRSWGDGYRHEGRPWRDQPHQFHRRASQATLGHVHACNDVQGDNAWLETSSWCFSCGSTQGTAKRPGLFPAVEHQRVTINGVHRTSLNGWVKVGNRETRRVPSHKSAPCGLRPTVPSVAFEGSSPYRGLSLPGLRDVFTLTGSRISSRATSDRPIQTISGK